VSDLEGSGYWAGWYDSINENGGYGGYDLDELIWNCEGRDWYAQDVAMLAALNVD